MKKSVLFILTFYLIATASALTISIPETVDQGGTILATLQGNILESITKEDVGFFEGHVQIPFEYDIEKIEDTYYIYALIPYEEKQYTLKIQDVYFKENNEFNTLDLEANFSVSNLTADFNVNPAFVITTEDFFEIELYNNLNSNLELTYEFSNITDSITLPLQETSTLKISTKSLDGTSVNTLSLSSPNLQYTLPIYVIREEFIPPPIIDENGTIIQPPVILEGSNIQFSADEIDEVIRSSDLPVIYNLSLANLGEVDTGPISLTVSDELIDVLDLEIVSIANLAPEEEVEIRFSIVSEATGEIEGGILAESEKSFDELEISLLIGENVEPRTSVRSEDSCSDLGGNICLDSQDCSGVSLPSAGNVFCCTSGSCTSPGEPGPNEKGSSTVTIIIIGVAVLIIIGVIFWRLKSTKKQHIKKSARFDSKRRRPGSLSLASQTPPPGPPTKPSAGLPPRNLKKP